MKISVSEEKKQVEEQRRQLEEKIADFQRRKVQYENDKMDKGHHTLTLGKLGKKKWPNPMFWSANIVFLPQNSTLHFSFWRQKQKLTIVHYKEIDFCLIKKCKSYHKFHFGILDALIFYDSNLD